MRCWNSSRPSRARQFCCGCTSSRTTTRGGDIKDVVHGSTKTTIRAPFALFDHEDLDDLKARFPAFTVLRKEKALTDEQWKRIRFDKLTQGGA